MKRWFGHFVLKIFGWRPGEDPPALKKYVLIANPHTSGWDLVFMMALAWVYGMKISWMGKHSLFKPPFGWFMRWLGGIPIDRRSKHNVVDQMIHAFEKAESLTLVVPTSGTRSYRDYWKSGFYYIAKGAGVPIVPGYLDFKTKVGGFGPPLYPSDDLVADMDILRNFYEDKHGKYPELKSRVRLRQEDELENQASTPALVAPKPEVSERQESQAP